MYEEWNRKGVGKGIGNVLEKGIGNVWGKEQERYVKRNMKRRQNGIGHV